MSKAVIIREFQVVFMLILSLVACTIKIVWKKALLTRLTFSEETNRKINIVCIPFVYLCLVFSLTQCIAVVRDIPSIINDEYSVDNAIVMNTSTEKKGLVIGRHVSLEINGKVEEYRLYSHEVYEGQEIKVVYLPYSNVAQMVGE